MQRRRGAPFLSLLQIAAVTCLTALASSTLGAEQLRPETKQAYELYVRSQEARLNHQIEQVAGHSAGDKIFLSIDALPEPMRREAYATLQTGRILVRPSHDDSSSGAITVPGGLIHDWTATVFIPGASLKPSLAVLQDYDRDAEYYGPQVVQSKLLGSSGNDFHIFLRLKQSHIVTVVFDTEYDVHYGLLDLTRAVSNSRSTRIAEVENAGTPREYQRPVGNDQGFLWALNSYWRFYQADGGLFIECRAISLTRDVPSGLRWLVRRFIQSVPQSSLRFTLTATRDALEQSPNRQARR